VVPVAPINGPRSRNLVLLRRFGKIHTDFDAGRFLFQVEVPAGFFANNGFPTGHRRFDQLRFGSDVFGFTSKRSFQGNLLAHGLFPCKWK